MDPIQERQHLIVAIDIGGTFTDISLIDNRNNRLIVAKELTSVEDPSRSVLSGLSTILSRNGYHIENLHHVVHATTLVTNALIERKGSRTGLITTKGFRDVIEISREMRYDIYDLFLSIASPIIPRSLRREVNERICAEGTVEVPIDLESIDTAVNDLITNGCESIAVCLLHSYQNPTHELVVAERIRKRNPSLYLSVSYEIAPEIREYERAVTTSANAYVQPLIDRYLGRLLSALTRERFRGRFSMMLSNGGLTTLNNARARPIGLLESGPAAGALIAGYFASPAEERHVLALDMGGTTAKACVVDDGSPAITYTFEAAREARFKRGSGLPIRTASVDLIEIGAGGGSLARVDDLGLLKVGPDSAGAVPGPACYGQGGTAPTVTDANLILGYYDADSFLGGDFRLDRHAATAAVGTLATQLGVSIEDAAWGIHDVVNEQMASAARIHLVERGRDPRRYALLATGGAGPCHGPRVAQKLRMDRVLCPPNAGVASSFGLLVAPPRIDLVRSVPMRLDEVDFRVVDAVWRDLQEQAQATLQELQIPSADIQFERSADMRYVGQGFEVTVPIPDRVLDNMSEGETLHLAFDRAYRQTGARPLAGVPIEILTWRLCAAGRPSSIDFLAAHNTLNGASQKAPAKASRQVYFPEWRTYRLTPVLDRYALLPGASGLGPTIIEERESTTVVPPHTRWTVDRLGILTIRQEQ